MPAKIYIHIGLHKTATRFLQRSVFKHLDSKEFYYNPEPFTDSLYRYIRDPDNAQMKSRYDSEYEKLATDTRHLLISLPDISGDMYNSHDNSQIALAILREKFPRARILFFVRDQADWLLSAYRQSIQKGVFGPIEVFLNFYDGQFQKKTAQRRGGMRNVDALGLKFLEIYQDYVHVYDRDQVFLVRYEDFRAQRDAVVKRLAIWLDLETLPVHLDGKKRHNRSFSALAINLFCNGMHPPKTPPRGSATVSVWQKKYSPMRIVRNLRRLFIKKVFDRIVYKDWDLLARNNMRTIIDEHYRQENQKIKEYARLD